jgi:hypothetical protein
MMGGLNDGRLNWNLMVVILGSVMRAMFTTGRTFGWMDQSLMSHQKVTANSKDISDWVIG